MTKNPELKELDNSEQLPEAGQNGEDGAARRVAALSRYDILDTPPEESFDRLTALAARLFQVPIALVSLLDAERQWFKSAQGLDVCQTGRDESFCRHAVRDDQLNYRQVLVVNDALQDARFVDSILVTGPPHIRFYAGAPLLSPEGVAIGTLCVIDTQPREFDDAGCQTLMDLAAVVSNELELRRAQQQVQQREEVFRALIENSSDIITVLDASGGIIYESPSMERAFGYPVAELSGRNVMEFVHENDLPTVQDAFAALVSAPSYSTSPLIEFRFRHLDGSWRTLESLARNLLDDKSVSGIVVNSRDITQRLQTESQLRERQQQLQMAMRAGGMGAWSWDVDSGQAVWSPEVVDLLGLPQEFEENISGSFDDFLAQVHPDDRECVKNSLHDAQYNFTADEELNRKEASGESSPEIEFRVRQPDGSVRWLSIRGRSMSLVDGKQKRVWSITSDITARKEQEAALRQSEERFQNAFKFSDIGMALVDLNGRWLRVNTKLCEFLGYSEEQLLKMDFQSVTFPDDLSSDVQHAQQLLNGEIQSYGIEKRYVRSDGEVVWALLNVSLVRDGEGRPLNFISQVQDISESKRVLRALQRSEARKAAVLETALDCIVTMNHHGKVLEWNPAAESTFGYSAEQIIGQELHALIVPPELQEAHRKGMRKYLATGEGPLLNRRIEMPAIHADGHKMTVELAIVPIGADPPIFIGHMRDVTERRRSEERLRLLESVAVHANDAIIITEAEPIDLPGPRIVYVNEAFTKSTGYSAEEVIGQSPRILQGAETSPEIRATIRGALKKWQPVEVEVLNYRKDGTSFWVELSIVPLANEKGWYTHWISIQRDVTARRQAADELLRAKEVAENAREEAENANRAKSEFLGRMSHELRTPLNAILGFGQLLELSSLDKGDTDSAHQIVKAGRHLLGLINEVLDIARIESGHLSLSIEPVSLSAIVSETLSLVRPLAAQRNIVPDADNVLEQNLWVHADHQRLRQVLLNLLSNAVKYNREGGIIELSCEARDELLHFSVRDNGKGIAPHLLPRLFTPFDRLGAENSGIEGSGVGLTLCKYLVEAMHGTIEAHSELNVGTTFHLTLPLATNPLHTTSGIVSGIQITMPQRATVLYIEDNQSNIELMARLLERHPNIALLNADNGQMGLELAAQHIPDLILLDFNLPGINGHDVLRRLQSNPAICHIPVIMVSADATPGQIQRLKDAGAREYLTKPFDIAELLRLLQDYLP